MFREFLGEDAEFQRDYAAARTAMFEAAMSRAQALSARAIDTLEDLLGAEKHPAVRLGAARTIIELGMYQRDAETIIRKLADIKAAQVRRAR